MLEVSSGSLEVKGAVSIPNITVFGSERAVFGGEKGPFLEVKGAVFGGEGGRFDPGDRGSPTPDLGLRSPKSLWVGRRVSGKPAGSVLMGPVDEGGRGPPW